LTNLSLGNNLISDLGAKLLMEKLMLLIYEEKAHFSNLNFSNNQIKDEELIENLELLCDSAAKMEIYIYF